MSDESRWERWGRWPYQVLGWALLLLPAGARFLPSSGSGSSAALSIFGFVCTATGAVLLGGSWWHRVRRAQDEEIRRNPSGKPVLLEERLATVKRPRARWALIVLLAVGFSLATAWAIYEAVRQDKSAYVGLAIYFFIPVPLLAWLAWRTRALRRGRTAP